MVQLLDSAGNPLKAKMQASDTAHRAASHRARELSSWLPPLGSADSDLLSELPTLVSRSRDLSRNHGVAAGAMQTLTYKLAYSPHDMMMVASRVGIRTAPP